MVEFCICGDMTGTVRRGCPQHTSITMAAPGVWRLDVARRDRAYDYPIERVPLKDGEVLSFERRIANCERRLDAYEESLK
jgi:hypothetical protein